MQDVFRFWLGRGADGYRIDAIDRLLKDPQLRDDPPATAPFGLPLSAEEARLALSHSRNAPDTGEALARMREAAGDAFLVGEVYLPSSRWRPYSDHFDAVFSFELLLASWDAGVLRSVIESSGHAQRAAWVMSNHDFGRLATRFGRANARAAALLLLTLPGPAFLYQGDEIGQGDGPPGMTAFDRAGRDRFRHPMQWDATPGAGFSAGQAWLPPVDPAERNVEAQRADPGSTLALTRELIALRRRISGELELLDAAPGVLAFRRGDHVVAVNTTPGTRPVPPELGDPVLSTSEDALGSLGLAPHAGVISSG